MQDILHSLHMPRGGIRPAEAGIARPLRRFQAESENYPVKCTRKMKKNTRNSEKVCIA